MSSIQAARRYSTALLELAKERKEVEEVLEDISFIQNTLEGSNELINFLKSPIIKVDDKMAALDTLFFGDLEKVTKLFIKLLARKDRINLLDQITSSFIEKYHEYAGIINVKVYVAQPLDDSQRKKLHSNLEQKTANKVDMEVFVDKSLRGGLAVRIDDTVIDGTVSHKLNQLEEKLLSTAAE